MANKPFILKQCLEERGKELDGNNQDIVKYLCSLQEERNNLAIIIDQQYLERKNIESEIEKLTYKLCLINKSLAQRIKAKNNYDKTIQEIESNYDQLVEGSNVLKKMLEKQHNDLDDMMNKKIGTGDEGGNSEVRTLYARAPCPPTASSATDDTDQDECDCARRASSLAKGSSTIKTSQHSRMSQEEPTRDNGETLSRTMDRAMDSVIDASRVDEQAMRHSSAMKPSSAKIRTASVEKSRSTSIEKARSTSADNSVAGSSTRYASGQLERVPEVESETKPPSIVASTSSEGRKTKRRSGNSGNSLRNASQTDSPRNVSHNVSYTENSNLEINIPSDITTETTPKTPESSTRNLKVKISSEGQVNATQSQSEDQELETESRYSEYSRKSSRKSDDEIEHTISDEKPPTLRSESQIKMEQIHLKQKKHHSDEFHPQLYKGVGLIKSENLATLHEIQARSVEKVEHVNVDESLEEENEKRKQRIALQKKLTLERMSISRKLTKKDNENQVEEASIQSQPRASPKQSSKSRRRSRSNPKKLLNSARIGVQADDEKSERSSGSYNSNRLQHKTVSEVLEEVKESNQFKK